MIRKSQHSNAAILLSFCLIVNTIKFSGTQNLAENRPTAHAGTNGQDWYGSLAVNGDIYSFTVTNTGDNDNAARWSVGLERDCIIQRIVIYPPATSLSAETFKYSEDAEITVDENDSSNSQDICAVYNNGPSNFPFNRTLNCYSPMEGRYMTFRRRGGGYKPEYLGLCDVQVIGDYIDPGGQVFTSTKARAETRPTALSSTVSYVATSSTAGTTSTSSITATTTRATATTIVVEDIVTKPSTAKEAAVHSSSISYGSITTIKTITLPPTSISSLSTPISSAFTSESYADSSSTASGQSAESPSLHVSDSSSTPTVLHTSITSSTDITTRSDPTVTDSDMASSTENIVSELEKKETGVNSNKLASEIYAVGLFIFVAAAVSGIFLIYRYIRRIRMTKETESHSTVEPRHSNVTSSTDTESLSSTSVSDSSLDNSTMGFEDSKRLSDDTASREVKIVVFPDDDSRQSEDDTASREVKIVVFPDDDSRQSEVSDDQNSVIETDQLRGHVKSSGGTGGLMVGNHCTMINLYNINFWNQDRNSNDAANALFLLKSHRYIPNITNR